MNISSDRNQVFSFHKVVTNLAQPKKLKHQQSIMAPEEVIGGSKQDPIQIDLEQDKKTQDFKFGTVMKSFDALPNKYAEEYSRRFIKYIEQTLPVNVLNITCKFV